MKKFLLLMALMLAICVPWAHAQNVSIYSFETGVDASKWVDISTGSTALEMSGTSDDTRKSAVTDIGFSFMFGGTAYTQFSVNADGNLKFGSVQTGHTAYATPFSSSNAKTNAPKINFFGADGKMTLTTGGGVLTKLIGEAPNRVLVVQFATKKYMTGGVDDVIWQVQLFETTNAIQIVYSPTAPTSTSIPATFQLGLSGSSTDIDVVRVNTSTNTAEVGASGNNNSVWPSPNRYYLFTIPTCFPPTGVTASNVTSTSADLSWTASGEGESQWQYVLTLPGETPDWSTATTVSTTSCSFTGLIPNKNYTFYVRSYCTATDQSAVVNAAVHTLFAPVTPTQFGTVSFEASEGFTGGTSGSTTTTLNGQNNWAAKNVGTTTAYTYIPFVYNSSSASSLEYIHSGIASLKLNAYKTSSYNYDYAYAALPQLDFTAKALNQHQVVFYARKTTASTTYNDTLWVGVMTDPTDYTTFTKVNYALVTSNVYAEYTVPLDSYDGNGSYIALWAETSPSITTGTRYGAFYVDDLLVEKIPTCKKPTGLEAANITNTQAVLSWTPGATETAWNLKYRVLNAEDWTTVNGVTNPYTITGLDANTQYEFIVQSDCSDEQSKWVTDPASFRTLCNPVDPVSLGTISFEASEGFAPNAGNLANCWTAGNLQSISTTYMPYVYTSYAKTGSYCLRVYASKTSTTNADSAYAVMPPMTFNGGINKYQVSFQMRKASTSTTTSYNDTLYVGIVQDPADLSTLQIVGTAVNTTTTYAPQEVLFSSYTASTTGYIVFLGAVNQNATATTKYGAFFIDDVVVEPIPACAVVASASTANVTRTSFTTNWVRKGSATNCIGYELKLSKNESPDSAAVSTIVIDDPDSTTVTFEHLDRATKYYVHIRLNCGLEDGYSKWVTTSATTQSLVGDACPAITGVAVSDIAEHTAKITWNASTADYFGSYDLLVSDTVVTDFEGVTFRHTGLTAATDTLMGLEQYHDYYIYVHVNCDGYGHDDGEAWSQVAHFKTLPLCKMPTGFGVQLISKRSAVASWTPGSTTQAANYRYILSTELLENPDTVAPTATKVNTNNILFNKLTAGETYYLYLSNDCGGADGYSPYIMTSFTMPAACIDPTDVNISDVQKYQMTLNWTPAQYTEATDLYDVIVSDTQVVNPDSVPVTYPAITGTSLDITLLQRETQYYVYLRTNCGEAGNGNWIMRTATTEGMGVPCLNVTAANGTDYNDFAPLYGYYADAVQTVQSIYPASMLTGLMGREISRLRYYKYSGGSSGWQNKDFKISLMITTDNSLDSIVDVPGNALVYKGKLAVVGDTMGIQLDQPFLYNGGNLLVQFHLPEVATYTSCKFNGINTSNVASYCRYEGYYGPNNYPQYFLPKVDFYACKDVEICPAVSAPVITDVTNTSATFTWLTGKGDFASSYDLIVSDTAVTDFENAAHFADGITDTTYSIVNGLTANTYYYSYVRVNCDNEIYHDGSSNWSSSAEFRTQHVCLRPESFVAGQPTSNSVPLSWTKKGAAQNWIIYSAHDTVVDTISVAATECTIVADTVSYTLTGLIADRAYTLQLISDCGETDSLSAPADLTPMFTTQDTVTGITDFNVSNAIVMGDVAISADNRTVTATLRSDADLTNIEFEYEYASYECTAKVGDVPFTSPWDFSAPVVVRVFAEDTAIYQDWTITLVKESCSTPFDFNVTNIERRTADLNWTIGDTLATSFDYILSDTAVVDFEAWTPGSIVATNVGGACTYNVKGLTRDSQYYAYVRTNCGAATGQWCGDGFKTNALVFCDSVVVCQTSTTDSNLPIYGMWADANYQKTQSLYPASMLTDLVGKSISKIKYFVQNGDNEGKWDECPITVRLGITSATSLDDGFITDVPMTQVYDSFMTANTTIGMPVEFDNEFVYTGGNLLIEFEKDEASDYRSVSFYAAQTSNNASYRQFNTTTNPIQYLPMIQFTVCQSADACPEVTDITSANIDVHTATVKWTKSTGDYAYMSDIYYSTNPDTTGVITAMIDSVTSDTFNLTNLDAYSTYYVYVRTHCNGEGQDDGVSPWVGTSFQTLAQCRVAGTPVATITGKHTATVNWTNTSGSAQQANNFTYILSDTVIPAANLETTTATATGVNAVSADFTNLTSATTYHFYVRNDCGISDGLSPWDSCEFTMYAAMPAVINITAYDIASNAFTATWEINVAEFADETAWQVAVVEEGVTPTTEWVNATTREHFALGLTASTTYDLHVRATDGENFGTDAMIKVTTAGAPTACVTVFDGTATTNSSPFYTYYFDDYTKANTIMPARALQSMIGRDITDMTFYISSGSKALPDTVEVYLKEVTDSSLNNPFDVTTATRVYRNPLDFSGSTVTVQFTAPYRYNGGNLLIATQNTTDDDYGSIYYYGVSGTGWYGRGYNGTSLDLVTSFGQTGTFAPKTQFCMVAESCRAITNLKVDNVTTATARAHWYPGNVETEWYVYNSPVKMTEEGLDTVQATQVTNNPMFAVTGLDKDMDYYFYVRGICSGTDTSRWVEYHYVTLPSCSAPINAVADNTADNEITFDAAAGTYGTVGTYDFRYWKDGGDTTTVTGQTSQYIANNLTSGALYHWQVRANCTGTEEGSSRWTNGNDVHVCGPLAIPYTDNFETYETGVAPDCWTTVEAYSTYPMVTSIASSKALVLTYTSAIATAPITVPAGGLKISFKEYASYYVYSDVEVGFSTDLSEDTAYTAIGTVSCSTSSVFMDKVLYMHEGNKTGYIVFKGDIGSSYYAQYIDDLRLETIPTYNVAAAPATTLGTVTVECNEGDTVSAGVFYEGKTPKFTAVPNTGIEFTNWTNANGGDTLYYGNPWTIKVAKDTSIVANFDTASYNLNVSVAPGQFIFGSVTGGGTYRYMRNQQFSAQPISHYHTVWSDGVTGNSRSIVMPAKDTTFVASFALDQHTLTVLMNDSTKGTVTGTGVYDWNSTIDITATPLDEHRIFTGWSNGETNPAISINLVGDSVVTANFVWDTHVISTDVNDATMGSVAGAGTYSHDSIATLTATPTAHHIFVNWNGVDSLTNPVLNHYVESDTTITANFDWDSHDITVLKNVDSMGVVTGTGNYYHGTTVTVTATPAEHHHFIGWSNGVEATSFTIVADTDSVVTAIFAIDQHTITAVPKDTARGKVYGSGVYNYGDTAVLVAEGIYPYQFSRWDDEALSETDTLLVKVLGDATYTAYFKFNEFDVITRSNDQNMGTILGGGSYVYDTIVNLTAVPAEHHHLVRWENNGSQDLTISHVVRTDTIIYATFGIDTFAVNAVANNAAMGTVTGSDLYPYGATADLLATPNAHYHFLGWSNGVSTLGQQINVTANTTVVATFAIDMHHATVSANDTTMGSVTGTGYYDYGTQVAITATPKNDHYSFVQWSNGDQNATTTIDLASDTAVTAIFAADYHDVTLNINGAGMGNVQGSGNYLHGSDVAITAIPSAHYHFVDWSNGLATETANITVISDTTIIANFAIDQHTVSAVANDAAMGTTTGTGTYNYGESADITATANEHYHFVGWNNGVATASQTINVAGDTTIIASFVIDQHNVTVLANDNNMGTVTGTGHYDYGTQVAITATPKDEHYSFVGWSNGNQNPTTTIDLAGDTTVTAIFAADSHTITLNVNDNAMGSVSGAGNYGHGATAAISATANTHYHFVDWSNGITTDAANILVESDSVITANFAVDQHNVTAITNDPARGSVTGTGVYNYGTTANLTATAAPHFHFVSWSDGVTTAVYSMNVAGDSTVIATFASDQHYVNGVANIPALGTVTGSGYYDYGSQVTLTATANDSHGVFTGWSNGATTPTIVITITGDTTVTANFTVDSHLITVNTSSVAMGTVTGGGTYTHGATATLTATANPHYHFLSWNNGMITPVMTVVVDRDSVFTASFAIDEHYVTAIPNNSTMGSVTGSGTYNYNTNAVLTATPVAHHHFVSWSNGKTTLSQTVRVISDTTVIANFEIDKHNLTVNASNANYGTVTGTGRYDYGTQVTITATPAANCVFTGWSNGLTARTAVIDLTKDSTVTAMFTRNEYYITLDVNDENMGTVEGEGSYTYGDVITLTATAIDDCHHFVRWSDGSKANPRTYTVTGNKSLTAIFAVNEYTVSVSSSNNKAGKAYINDAGTQVTRLTNVYCESQVEIHAEPADFYRFIEWSDGVTDDVRYIDVISDTSLVALFEPNCGDYADFPVEFLYNGLVMLDLDSIKSRGYNPQADQVSWYRVVNDVDPLDASVFPVDDRFICTGYYLSLPTNELGYGSYYAVVDVSNTPHAICNNKMRSVVVDYYNDQNSTKVEMAPTDVKDGDIMTITGLMPDERTTITVYDYTGKAINVLQTEGLDTYSLQANGPTGVYMVKVVSDSVNETLRFIITK